MALGKMLREARERHGYSTSEVAEATNMMVQMVEELEREDFHRIAAPIYGKGFIRLFAEYVELDPAPLVEDFVSIYSGGGQPSGQGAAKRGHLQPEADETVKPIPIRAAENCAAVATPPVTAGEPGMHSQAPSLTPAPAEPEAEREEDAGLGETGDTPPAEPAVRSPAAPAIEKPVEPDLFNYTKVAREQKLRPSLQLGGGREDPEKAERAARAASNRKAAARRRQEALAGARQLAKSAGSVGFLIKKIFGKMPIRDLAVVIVVLVMLVLIVFGINHCVHLSDNASGGTEENLLERRVISPPEPFVD